MGCCGPRGSLLYINGCTSMLRRSKGSSFGTGSRRHTSRRAYSTFFCSLGFKALTCASVAVALTLAWNSLDTAFCLYLVPLLTQSRPCGFCRGIRLASQDPKTDGECTCSRSTSLFPVLSTLQASIGSDSNSCARL